MYYNPGESGGLKMVQRKGLFHGRYTGGEPVAKISDQTPSTAQRRYLEPGLAQPGGKLPLFDDQGQRIDQRTVRACIERGWAEPWINNPIKLDWLVCRLTDAGRQVLNI